MDFNSAFKMIPSVFCPRVYASECRCLWRPEAADKSPNMGAGDLSPLQKQGMLLTAELHLPTPPPTSGSIHTIKFCEIWKYI